MATRRGVGAGSAAMSFPPDDPRNRHTGTCVSLMAVPHCGLVQHDTRPLGQRKDRCTMRMLLTVSIPVAKGNAAITDGSLARVLEAAMGKLKPEAAYFATIAGKRGGFMVFDLTDLSQIPAIAEPFFQELEAEVTFAPVMTAEDLQKGLASAGQAGRG